VDEKTTAALMISPPATHKNHYNDIKPPQ